VGRATSLWLRFYHLTAATENGFIVTDMTDVIDEARSAEKL
jgi:hypothetical protein